MKALVAAYFTLLVAIVGCDVRETLPSAEIPAVEQKGAFIKRVEESHQKALLDEYDVIQFELERSVGAEPMSVSTITASTDGGRIRLDDHNGRTVIWDRGEFRTNNEASEVGQDRFDVFAWQYFFMLPYKLSDQGANVLSAPTSTFDGQYYETSQLRYDQGVGDDADHAFTLFVDEGSGWLRHATYRVSKQRGSAGPFDGQSAHCITFGEYRKAAGIPIARRWTFSKYDALSNVLLDSVGYAKVSKISFPDASEVSWEL